MKKQFGAPTPQQPKKPKETKPLDKMPKECRDHFTDFFGNIQRLYSELNLCQQQYDISIQKASVKELDVNGRIMLRRISTYWNQRKLAMERALDAETLEKINALNQPET